MARRRNSRGIEKKLMSLAAMLALGCAFSPPVRAVIQSIGLLTLIFFGVGLAALLGFAIYYRRISSSQNKSSFNPADNPFQKSLRSGVPNATVQPCSPQSDDHLRQQLYSIDWFQFEKLVGHLYRKLGHAVTFKGGANPDGGIDLIVEMAGQRKAIQCKHWKGREVGVKTVREFFGALADAGLSNGVIVSLRGGTPDAKQFASRHSLEILEEGELLRLLRSTDAMFDPEVLELLHDKRKFCPKCNHEMVRRVSRKSVNYGQEFWGCSTYPRCHFKLQITSTKEVSNRLSPAV
ncbi:MAG TPA: restriction endonuclease [Verrucomicrobiae bacterium]|nr:restriction endonuclease [Verrucomicrobiae bacterium]